MKMCKACGKPIKINEKISDVFEDMHWICFHMLFEHDDYDPDEPCDDPSCPWNQISGRATHLIYQYSDLKYISQDGIGGIFLTKKSIETERLPSVEFELIIIDEFIRNYSEIIWIECNELRRFRDNLTLILSKGYGKANLEAMSANDFSIEIESIGRAGNMIASYRILRYKTIEGYNKTISYQNTFQFEFNQLERYINRINRLLEVFK